jgi:HEAT repeat protein
VPALAAMLHDKDDEIRYSAAAALAEIGPNAKEAVPELAKAVAAETDTRNLEELIYALGEIGPESHGAVPAMLKLIHHEDEEVRQSVLDALSVIRPTTPAAIKAIATALDEDKAVKVRLAAAYALNEIGAPAKSAVPALIKALAHDKNAGVRSEAAHALGSIGDSEATVHEALKAALKDADADVHTGAEASLKMLAAKK